MDGGVLGEDRDAALALEVDVVHRPLGHALVRAEHPALVEQAVDERGLAVIDVRDDGDVAPERVRDGRRGVCRRRHPTSIARGPRVSLLPGSRAQPHHLQQPERIA